MPGRISLGLRIAAVPVLSAVIFIVETRHPYAMFRLLTFGAGFFLLADLASLFGGKARDFLITLTSLAFGICLIEAAAIIWEPKEPTVILPKGLSAVRPIIGWGPVHAGRYHVNKTDLLDWCFLWRPY